MWDLWLFIVLSIVFGFSGRTAHRFYAQELSNFHPDEESQSVDPFFRKDYVYISQTKSFYKLHRLRLNWWGAKMRCAMEGALLWIPETKKEVAVVTSQWFKGNRYIRKVYLGIKFLMSEGDFVTIDGRNIQHVYNRWMIYEPYDLSYNEDCVLMYRNGLISDVSCFRHEHFMCKKTLATLTWNFLCNLPDPDYIYNGDIGKCYKIHKTRKTWSEAYSTCNAEESYLAVVNSQTEANVIAKILDDSPIRNKTRNGHVLLIGFHNEYDEVWTTVHGATIQEAGFEKWAETKPNGYKYRYNRCGAFTYTGELYDVNCGTYEYFMCEHDVDALVVSIDERFPQIDYF